MSARSPVKKGEPSVKKRWRYETPLEHVESPLPDVRGVVGKDNEYLHRNRRIYFSSYAGGWKSLRSRTLPTLRGTHALPPDAHRWRPQARVVHEGYANACWSGALIRAEPIHLPTRAERARERGLLRDTMPVLAPQVEALRTFGQFHGEQEREKWIRRTEKAHAETERLLADKQAMDDRLKELEASQPTIDDMLKFVSAAAKDRANAFKEAADERARVAELRAEVEQLRAAVAQPKSVPPGIFEELEAKRANAQAQRQRLGQLLSRFEFEAQRRCLRALGEDAAPVPSAPAELLGATASSRRPSKEDVEEKSSSRKPSFDASG